MTSPDTQKMMDLVEENTGYKVALSTSSEIATHGQMTSASKHNPMHLINVSTKYPKYGDYIVAIQCAMLLIKWRHPKKLPNFALRNDKIKYLVNKFSKKKELNKTHDHVAQQYSRMIVQGILQQLNSIPSEMMAIDMCFELCPGLHSQQAESIKNTLRELTSVLNPRIRKQTPSEIFEKNAAMNTAFALHWCKYSNETTSLTPFKVLGFLHKGQELFDAYETINKDSPDRYVATIDAWAKILKMSTWYKWEYSDKE